MWFDHHSREFYKSNFPKEFNGIVDVAPSAAGTCQPPIEDTERIFKEVIHACKD